MGENKLAFSIAYGYNRRIHKKCKSHRFSLSKPFSEVNVLEVNIIYEIFYVPCFCFVTFF